MKSRVISPLVEAFFHQDTSTFTYVVFDHHGGSAVIIDPVLDFDAPSARTWTASADAVLDFVHQRALAVEWILETHAHADHLSAGGYLHDVLGAPLGIGAGIVAVQKHFKDFFGLGAEFVPDGHQFDRLLSDGDQFSVGTMEVRAIGTPGHTSDSLAYVIGDAAFVGDTVFAPGAGTARTDFPGGDAHALYVSIQKILALPRDTRVFLCHDYPLTDHAPSPETSAATQAAHNIHVGGGVPMAEFVEQRRARDASLPPPRLLLPALQVNIRGGRLPAADSNGVRYLRLPLNRVGVSV